ncbi:GNAT family N-acetyltransferase [Paenibacillus herberti]|uniref:GNAT family N-acetyltransferase n=1 Tax=Paenibacillus herberti TaxID=1619309 RepID=UPI00159552C5|nr:GNAT family N-acetyltransferase [Paenibacillus herberti]
MRRARNVAVLVYEKVDLLDVAGPFDVFAVSSKWGEDFNVYTVGERSIPVNTISGLSMNPRYSFDDCPVPDILIVPGGIGARTTMHNEVITTWIREMAEQAELVLSVCTGALLLATANLLDGLKVTTNRRAFDLLREVIPQSATIVENVRYVDNGKIVLSAGVTAGIDAALHIVSRLHGSERALETASMLEHDWSGRLIVRRAQSEDIDAMQHLYVEAAKWIRSMKGIVQWGEEDFTREYMEQFIREKEVFVAYMNGELSGCFSVQWEYEEIWGDLFHDQAGYVHRLAVSRNIKGQGIGSRLLDWAEAYIKNKGKTWMRLDCMADNPTLNDYYRSQGLVYCGRHDDPRWSANLYERKIK